MTTLATQAVRLVRAAKKAYARKWSFLALFVLAFFASFIALDSAGIVPNPLPAATDPVVAVSSVKTASPLVASVAAAVPATGDLPVRIEIPAIGLSAKVANPQTTDIESLDRYLLAGAVRYPTSAKLGKPGNVILFAHSSYLPVVSNQAYKTFNGIQKLHAGDAITVYSSGRAYQYRVDTVTKQDAQSAAIPLSVEGSKLTLSTCDSFGTKSERFVVTASLVGSDLLGA